MSLIVATYFWSDPASRHKFEYSVDDVRTLQRMVKRHLSMPHEFAVITDRPHLFDGDKDIRAIPLNTETEVAGTCFVRLMTFHPMGRDLIGERVLQIDLDTIIVGEMAPVVDRGEDLVLWRNPCRVPWDVPVVGRGRPFYNTSLLLHRCGTMPEVHMKFDRSCPGYRDDQWYLSESLGPDVPYWDALDGVYRLAREDTPGSGVNCALPKNARVVTFPGSNGKWTLPHIAAANPWIREFRV